MYTVNTKYYFQHDNSNNIYLHLCITIKSSHTQMGKVISIANHKGGVGKTTTTINMGFGLAKLGKKVLLIDMDPQANLSQSLGLYEPDNNIYLALRGDKELSPIRIEGEVDVIPSTISLAGAEVEFASEIGSQNILRGLLSKVKDQYDYIILDCPPSLGLLTINSFTASDEVFIAVQAEYLALQGLDTLSQALTKVQQRLNDKLKLTGVLITRYDKRKVLCREVHDNLLETFGDTLFKTKISDNIAIAEAPSAQVDIFRYAPKSQGAKDYFELCNEVAAR